MQEKELSLDELFLISGKLQYDCKIFEVRLNEINVKINKILEAKIKTESEPVAEIVPEQV